MEVRLFRVFRESKELSAEEANRIFETQGIWSFLGDCYDELHHQGDEAILDDINQKLINQRAA